MRKIVLFALLIFVATLTVAYRQYVKGHKKLNLSYAFNAPKNLPLLTSASLKLQVDSLKNFAENNAYNSETIFLINMAIHSGKARFFVFNTKLNKAVDSGLVAHGETSHNDGKNLLFSNGVGSNATSLGKYSIGKEYKGKFGTAFKLHGLDSTNSNAFKRFVVLHAHKCVATSDIYPMYTCLSQGCPTVSPSFLLRLKKIINKSKLPMLVSIVYDA
jgi:hypothetical protein